MNNNINKAWKIINLKSISSTQDYAKELITNNKINHRTAITAEIQTKGRGRKTSRVWQSPKGNLYLSAIIENKETNLYHLSFVASISIFNSLKKLGLKNIKLKYPNDVLVNFKKISGLLIEKEADFAIIGIGININSHPKKTNNYPAASILSEGVKTDKEILLNILLDEIKENYQQLKEKGFISIKNIWLKNSYGLNKEVKIIDNEKIRTGIFINLSPEGFMLIKDKKGSISKIYSGDIKFPGINYK